MEYLRDVTYWIANITRTILRGRSLPLKVLTTEGGGMTPAIYEQITQDIRAENGNPYDRILLTSDSNGVRNSMAAPRQMPDQYNNSNQQPPTSRDVETKTSRSGEKRRRCESCIFQGDVGDVIDDIYAYGTNNTYNGLTLRLQPYLSTPPHAVHPYKAPPTPQPHFIT